MCCGNLFEITLQFKKKILNLAYWELVIGQIYLKFNLNISINLGISNCIFNNVYYNAMTLLLLMKDT